MSHWYNHPDAVVGVDNRDSSTEMPLSVTAPALPTSQVDLSMPLLRETITFERRVQTAVGDGNTESSWDTANPLCTVRAELRPVNGREEVMAQKLQGVQPFVLTVRYCAATAGVTPEDHAVNARTGVAYDITAIQNPDMRQQWLSMIVREGTGDG